MNPKYHTDESITILTHAHIFTQLSLYNLVTTAHSRQLFLLSTPAKTPAPQGAHPPPAGGQKTNGQPQTKKDWNGLTTTPHKGTLSPRDKKREAFTYAHTDNKKIVVVGAWVTANNWREWCRVSKLCGDWCVNMCAWISVNSYWFGSVVFSNNIMFFSQKL